MSESESNYKIAAFYEFKDISELEELAELKARLKSSMQSLDVRGTILLAPEGYNGMVCGLPDRLDEFLRETECLFNTSIRCKFSFNENAPFRKTEVRIKPEIVTLRREVNFDLAAGTHVDSFEWNKLISDPETVVLDTRNDYEYETGTFVNAVNPGTEKFSDLPDFVAHNLDPSKHKTIAMFCTGGIRCEKFTPYMKQLGFENVFQLDGGILKYLEDIGDTEENLWQGECFVFDERVTVDRSLQKGTSDDRSQRTQQRVNPKYKLD
jgi:UPF0176 protein